jgi:hypothetical protein
MPERSFRSISGAVSSAVSSAVSAERFLEGFELDIELIS